MDFRLSVVAGLAAVAGFATSCQAPQNTSCDVKLPVMATGGRQMPAAWVDSATGRTIFKLTPREGSNKSFYFHNNPFVGDEMIFHGGEQTRMTTDQRHGADAGNNFQLYAVNLKTFDIRQITHQPYSVQSETLCPATGEIFFQHADSIFACRVDNSQLRFIATIPEGRTGNIVCVNADGSLLAGTYNNPKEAEILRDHPQKGEFFNLIYDAHLEKTIFTLDTRSGQFSDVWTDNAWLNHLQFSPSDPNLLMFCHEGPWHKVTRVWLVDVEQRAPRAVHQRTMDMEIWGHEWFGANGKTVYFDLQQPKGQEFLVGKVDIASGTETDYKIRRSQWSVHFVSSWDESFLLGDGGSRNKSVAHDPDGQWIYRFDYPSADNGVAPDSLLATKLVDMSKHDYALEPNIHLSPDGKWVIFRANFEGHDDIYAVVLSE